MLRILDYSWHQVHSYRLHALPAEFTYVIFRHPIWTLGQRPMPDNFRGGVYPDQVDVMQYDLALLHLDQWCGADNNLRALPFRLMNQICRELPRVIIMHGTPDSESNRREILQLMDDLPVVCNSHAAALEWDGGEGRVDRYGVHQFRTIIHGYAVDEFDSRPFEERDREVITICSGGDMSREYHGLPLVERLKRDTPLVVYGPRGDRPWMPDYAQYRALLARTLCYLSPTRRAPMPGARTEAMLSGCCVVTAPGQDGESFIRHGQTGIVAQTYTDMRDYVQLILEYPEEAYRVGQAGREAARELFDQGRYVAAWLDILREMGVYGLDG